MFWYLRLIPRAGCLALVCALLSQLALAEPKGDGGKSAIRRAEQRARSAEQAKAAAEAEEEARRSGKPGKRKKTDDTTKLPARKDPPGPHPD